ncbi:MAG TPA: insulinase family protein [Firmicutes bacterium]|nr:insulinase family protein [Bacillota bacterium]
MLSRTKLDNGLTVVYEQIPNVRSVAIGFWVTCGSRNEAHDEQGISHLIEHMLFKGTKQRSARKIAETIDAVGGILNAFTTKEYTCYYVKILDQHLRLGLDLLADMVINSLFAEEELEKEKNVILEELRMYEDNPDELIYDLLVEALLKDHPLGHPILGTPESIAQIDRNKLIHYKEGYYTAENSCLAIAGNFEVSQLLEESNHFWQQLPKNLPLVQNCPVQTRGTTCLRRKETEQVHLCVGVPGFHRHHQDRYPLLVLNNILGGSSSSRLFQELREERGLVYSTGAYYGAFRDTGIFSIYAGTSIKNFPQVLSLIREELNRLQKEAVPAEELARAKEQIKGNLWLSLENTINRMSRLAKSELFYGRFLPPEEVLAKVEKVTAEDIIRLSRLLFEKDQLTLMALGPFQKNKTEEYLKGWKLNVPSASKS